MGVNLEDVHAVLLLGGGGTRLWPLSTDAQPKQFLKIFDGKSLFQLALERIRACQINTIHVVTNQCYLDVALLQASALEIEIQFILEPMRRDSAPAIAAAAAAIAGRVGAENILAVFPCDHLINDNFAFCKAVNDAILVARSGELVTFGILPTAPSSEYGYIQKGLQLDVVADAYRAIAFKEKPCFETAVTYLTSGTFYWNSGIYFFRLREFRNEAAVHMPQIWIAAQRAVERGEATKDVLLLNIDSFKVAEKISIDYALFEKSQLVAILPRNFAWSDVGTWESLYDSLPHDTDGNVVEGSAEIYDSRNTLVCGDGVRVIALGLDELVVIASVDGVFVAPKRRAGEIKKLLRNSAW